MMGFLFVSVLEMKLITKQILANKVAERWRKQYPLPRWSNTNKEIIYFKLIALGENPPVNEVDEIIGNNSWTQVFCECCEKDVDLAVSIDLVSNDDAWICVNCLQKAVDKKKELTK